MLSSFVEAINLDSVRVYPPTHYVLLCGGEVSAVTDPVAKSIRDGFLRGDFYTALGDAEVLQIEEIQEFFEKDSPYDDLVEFERDIAQLAELTILFSEGPGSFAELGAFSLIDEIKGSLLVVIQRKFLDRHSFITKGPIQTLQRNYPNSVFSIVDSSVDIANGDVSTVNSNKLLGILKAPIETRLKETRSRTTLDRSKFNHLCKVYVGLLLEFYALKDNELMEALGSIGFKVDLVSLNRVAFCCAAVGWSGTTLSGFDRVHFALVEKEAAIFQFAKPHSDRIRRRTEIRTHWETRDLNRVAAVDERLAAR